MAKAAKPLAVGDFTVDFGDAPPPIQRLAGGASSPYTPVLKAMPAPQDGKVAQFFIKADVPASITDAKERERALKDEARKISNRVSGISRRLMEEKDANGVLYNFALRTQTDKDGNIGVRVYRIAPATPKPAE